MIAYPDTSFLCSVYREQAFSKQADKILKSLPGPLIYTGLLEFEFRQAIELQVFLHSQDRAKGYSRHEAGLMLADWEADCARGLNRIVPCDLTAVLHLSQSLSTRHTAQGGHRTLDILHVATAVHLGAEKFLTFDARQRALATHAGLTVPS